MMQALLLVSRHSIKKLKNVAAQSWIEKPADAYIPFSERDLSHLNIQNYREIKKTFEVNIDESELKPYSPVMGPIKVENPKVQDKMYRWCSCGQSMKQPFCDGSHEGSKFVPMKFTVQRKVKEMNLCGCKLSKNKPFCDGQSCKEEKTE